MDDRNWERWGALGGILFVVLVAITAILPGYPPKTGRLREQDRGLHRRQRQQDPVGCHHRRSRGRSRCSGGWDRSGA